MDDSPSRRPGRGWAVAAGALLVLAAVSGALAVVARIAQRPPGGDLTAVPDGFWKVPLAAAIGLAVAALGCALVLWRRRGRDRFAAGVAMLGVVVVAGASLGVLLATSHAVDARVMVVERASGTVRWTEAVDLVWVHTVSASPSALTFAGFASVGPCESVNRTVTLAAADGAPLDQVSDTGQPVGVPPTAPAAPLTEPLFTGEGVVVTAAAGQLDPASGRVTVPAGAGPPPASIVAALPAQLSVRDQASGAERWTVPLESWTEGLAVTPTRVFVLEEGGSRLVVRDLQTGRVVGRRDLGGEAGLPLSAHLWSEGDLVILLAGVDGSVSALEPDGGARWTVDVPELDPAATRVWPNGDSLVVTRGGRAAYFCEGN